VISKGKILFAVILTLAAGIRAVSFGTALFAGSAPAQSRTSRQPVPRPVRFQEVRGRGLLVSVWVNSAGPFTFAIDTGAGSTLVSSRVAAEARLNLKSARGGSIAGLTGSATSVSAARPQSLAIGDSENYLPSGRDVLVTSGLPRDIDGVLDPTEAFSPLGYIIDIPRRQLSAFEPRDTPIRLSSPPQGGAVVSWLRERNGRRPFVQLDNGDRVLIDTGSSFGLAIRDPSQTFQSNESVAQDIGGGRIFARRVRPTTVAIGTLTLQNVPTDLVSGTEADSPTLLGLNALRPFRLTFDPVKRLIEIAPADNRQRS
jgi:predicted aspartyl protease